MSVERFTIPVEHGSIEEVSAAVHTPSRRRGPAVLLTHGAGGDLDGAGLVALAELAVVGLPDDRLGERLVAAVVAEDGFDAEAFLRWARAQVAGYRRPTEVVELDALARGANGKLDRDAITDAVARARDGVQA